MRSSSLVVALILCACTPKPTPIPTAVPIGAALPPDAAPVVVAPPTEPQRLDIDSIDILSRDTVATSVLVKHVLIGWSALAENYHGQQDPRGAKRSQEDAARLAVAIAASLRADPTTIDALIKQNSEDPGSLTGEPYSMTADTAFVPEFKQLGLRLAVNEVGIVTTTFGYHVMMRVAPPPPDPLESAAILARDPTPGDHEVRHILIGWDGRQSSDANAKTRTKAEADTLAKELFDKLVAGADIVPLMKKYSEDPGSKDSGKTYQVTPTVAMVEPFKNLAMRLRVNEVGMVITVFGWHIIKRVPPPPPEAIESGAILARKTVFPRVKVKHILVGPANGKDHDAQVKGVKAALAKLGKGTDFDKLMAQVSEDPGGTDGYEVKDDSPMVESFKKLSLRLKTGELGVVKSEFGFHIVKRVE